MAVGSPTGDSLGSEGSGEYGPLARPISGDKPAGDDLSFDGEFEKVAHEIEKLERMDGTRPDWQLVDDVSTSLLESRTKDMRLAVWGAAAKVHRRKWRGLPDALGQCRDVCEPFWDAMFPPAKRARARANLYDWFVHQALIALEEVDAHRDDETPLHTAERLLAELDPFLEGKLGDMHQGSMRLRTLIQRKAQEIPPPTPPPATTRGVELSATEGASEATHHEPEAANGAPSSIARSAERPGPGLTMPRTVDEAHERVAQCENLLLECARLIGEQDLADARAFRLRRAVLAMRFAQWSGSLDGPDESLRHRLAELAGRFDMAQFLAEAEAAVVAFPAWLDAHRMVIEAADKLGLRFAEVRQVAAVELLSLAHRLPALATSVFRDGTAAADARTQAWIDNELRRAVGASAMVGAEDQETQSRYQEVSRLASEGRVPDAVTLAIGLANRAGDARGRFRGYLLAGKTALDHGHPAIARPLLEGLLRLVDQHHLETWEPGLCVVLYGSLLSCIRSLGGENAESSTRERDLFDKLCRLDPAAAMRLGGAQ